MLARNVDMSSLNASFDLAPKSFQGINVVDAIDVFSNPMMNVTMPKTPSVQVGIRFKFIGTNRTSDFNVILDNALKGFFGNIGDNLSHNIPATFYHPKDNGFAFCAATATPMMPSPDHGFIGFDMARKVAIPINSCHILSNLMGHTPSSFIGNAKLPLEFFCRDTMTGGSEKIHGIKPLLKRGMGVLKRGSRHWVNMMPAPLTHINGLFFELVEFSVPFALRAIQFFAKTGFHQVREARIIIRELLEKLLNYKGFFHGLILHDIKYNTFLPYVKGINTHFYYSIRDNLCFSVVNHSLVVIINHGFSRIQHGSKSRPS